MPEGSSLQHYLAVLRRAKWLVVLAVVVVPAVAVALSLLQTPEYQASAEVLLSRQSLAAVLSNLPDQTLSSDPARLAQTQADLAQVPEVAARAIKRARIKNLTPAEFLDRAGVSAKSDADLLVFTFKDRYPAIAAGLATLYARAYIGYRAELDTAAITRARRGLQVRIARLNAAGDQSSALYASLAEKEQQLATMEALQTANASLVKPAQNAKKIRPRPVRNGIFGLVLGVLLGIALAFLREALDTRIRSPQVVARRLGLPILAQIPPPPRTLRNSGGLAMLEGPETLYAEPFRILRTSLDLIDPDRPSKTIMVTSAVEGEGKSTTIANLAVASARAGREVILVDLDFRHPYLRTFFPDVGPQGLTDVVVGRLTLGEALRPVMIGATGQGPASNGKARHTATLRVLSTGTLPPNPGEFIGSEAIDRVLADLRERADLVLIDSAPILGIGDSLALASKVDAVLLVTRLNLLRRPMLADLERALARTQAKPLGLAVTGAGVAETYGYAYGYANSSGDSFAFGDEQVHSPESELRS
jgi:succinoglycan biosynthesis transport protein ExoP